MPTELERAIRAQPEALRRLAGLELPEHARRLGECSRVWLVGTGTSSHAAELGSAMLARAGIDARYASSMQFVLAAAGERLLPGDGAIVISHTGRSAYARAARASALEAAVVTVSITAEGMDWPEAIQTVPKERSHTYTISYLGTLAAIALIAHAYGAEGLGPEAIEAAADAVADAIESPGIDTLPDFERLLVLTGTGPAAVSAREGALKVREAARRLAEGFDGEFLLHGSAVPLDGRDALVLLQPSRDPYGLLPGLGRAAEAEGVPVGALDDDGSGDPVLSQLALTARLQLLALELSARAGQDPDKAIVGAWYDDALWERGAP
jgi:glucosamine--fructose-6-phosphate aminotransferase (isomerizing)